VWWLWAVEDKHCHPPVQVYYWLSGVGRVCLFDIQGWITLILGGLLALITLFTSYSHVHLPFLGSIALNQQGLFR
jgi:hypothetical protein